MDNKLRILIETLFNGKGAKEASDSITQLDEKTGKYGQNATASIGGVQKAFLGVAAGVYTAKKAIDFAESGAKVQLLESQFENLAASIDTTAASLKGKLQEASKGLVSDAELIAGAGQIISLGLADSEEGVVRLATAVSTLGLDMQQVILTFANNSTARLDALGLSVEGVTQKAKELEAQGFVGDAFDEAVIIALEEKMTLLGDASQQNIGIFQILRAEGSNLADNLSILASDALAPAASEMGNLLGQAADTVAVMSDLRVAVRELSGEIVDNVSTADDARNAGIQLVQAWDDTRNAAGLFSGATAEVKESLRQLIAENANFAGSNEDLYRSISRLTDSNVTLIGNFIMLDGRIIGTRQELEALRSEYIQGGQAGYVYADSQAGVANSLSIVQDFASSTVSTLLGLEQITAKTIRTNEQAEIATLNEAAALHAEAKAANDAASAHLKLTSAKGFGEKLPVTVSSRGRAEAIEQVERISIGSSNNVARIQERNDERINSLRESNEKTLTDLRESNEERIQQVKDNNIKKIADAEIRLAKTVSDAKAKFEQERINSFEKNLQAVEAGEDSTVEERIKNAILGANGATADAIRDELIASGVVSAEAAAEAWARTMREEGGKAIADAFASGDLVGTVGDAMRELERQIAAGEDIDLSQFGINEADLQKFMDAETYAFEQSKAQAQELADIKKQAALDEIQARDEANERMIEAQERASERMAEAVNQAAEAMTNAYQTGASNATTAIESIPDEVTTIAALDYDKFKEKISETNTMLDELDGKTVTSTVNVHTSYSQSGEPPPQGSGYGGYQAPDDEAYGNPPPPNQSGGYQQNAGTSHNNSTTTHNTTNAPTYNISIQGDSKNVVQQLRAVGVPI